MLKAILLVLLAVARPVQAEFAYVCHLTGKAAGVWCETAGMPVAARGGAGEARAVPPGTEVALRPCTAFAARACMQAAAEKAEHWAGSVSPDRNPDDDPSPAVAHAVDGFSVPAPSASLHLTPSFAGPPFAGSDTWLLTRRLRI
ncbi:MAG TPA: hypothetical protein VE175_00140 [Woeseiaceae bacterium]|jgi:hypothetical protein|nr:hypothetical protein [Woeseiaceae bacterium]